jgi:hypothetical protein
MGYDWCVASHAAELVLSSIDLKLAMALVFKGVESESA